MFEPQFKIYNFIKKKYRKNKKIKIYNLAVSYQKKLLNLNLSHHDLTSSLSGFNKNNFYLRVKSTLFGVKNMTYKKIKIKTTTLEYILKKNLINYVDVLKIDTEGHELYVLKGLKKKIHEVRYVLIEFHNDKIYSKYNPKNIHKFLTKNNFILEAKFKFPFTTWEDRVYFNKNAN